MHLEVRTSFLHTAIDYLLGGVVLGGLRNRIDARLESLDCRAHRNHVYYSISQEAFRSPERLRSAVLVCSLLCSKAGPSTRAKFVPSCRPKHLHRLERRKTLRPGAPAARPIALACAPHHLRPPHLCPEDAAMLHPVPYVPSRLTLSPRLSGRASKRMASLPLAVSDSFLPLS